MQTNTRVTGAAIPEPLEEAARGAARSVVGDSYVSLGTLIRAGLQVLAGSDPEVMRRAIAAGYLKPGPKKTH